MKIADYEGQTLNERLEINRTCDVDAMTFSEFVLTLFERDAIGVIGGQNAVIFLKLSLCFRRQLRGVKVKPEKKALGPTLVSEVIALKLNCIYLFRYFIISSLLLIYDFDVTCTAVFSRYH